MFKSFFLFVIRIMSFIPMFRLLIKLFYIRSKVHAAKLLHQVDDIVDVVFISNENEAEFVYGQSDYNIFVVVNDNCHPKNALTEVRQKLKSNFFTNMTFNTLFIPVLTEQEYGATFIQKYLLRSRFETSIKLKSLFHKKDHLHLENQNTFNRIFGAIQDLDQFLFQRKTAKSYRAKIKRISRATKIITSKHIDTYSFSKKLLHRFKYSLRYPIFAKLFYNSTLQLVWRDLTGHQTHKVLSSRVSSIEALLEKDFFEHLSSLLRLSFIDDITVTPSIIQKNRTYLSGKIFIEVHINEKSTKNTFFHQLENLVDGIHKFETKKLKMRVRLITTSLYQLQNTFFYYPFPLEPLYRKQASFSLAHIEHYQLEEKHLVPACINFLTIQFFRFRSSEQKTDLIGSKFIKSLNLMYRFYLVSAFLENKDFKILRNEKLIRESLSPQFSEIKSSHIVNEEDWLLIRAQMIYLLKRIRKQLLKHDKDLTLLRF